MTTMALRPPPTESTFLKLGKELSQEGNWQSLPKVVSLLSLIFKGPRFPTVRHLACDKCHNSMSFYQSCLCGLAITVIFCQL